MATTGSLELDELLEKYPGVSWDVFRDEGNALAAYGEHRKAIEAYDKAVILKKADNKHIFLLRANCQLELGEPDKALADLERALEEDPIFPKALYLKAESFYIKGDFEDALMFFHRGMRLRPEDEKFRLGIQKAQLAIENSVGESANLKLTLDGDLSVFTKMTERKVLTRTKSHDKNILLSAVLKAQIKSHAPVQQKARMIPKPKKDLIINKSNAYRDAMRESSGKNKTVRSLLGELYGDKVYLQELLDETDYRTDTGSDIYNILFEGISYLKGRAEFWRQQHPEVMRRKQQQRERKTRSARSLEREKRYSTRFVVRELEAIDRLQNDGRYEDSIRRAKKALHTVENLGDGALRNREDTVANLHSCLGNAYIELKQFTLALHHHQIDQKIGDDFDIAEATDRALDNIGRCYARMGEYSKAIQMWKGKLPRSKTELESTWLHHEIGRCYLELGDYTEAAKHGEEAFKAVTKTDDGMWKINVSVLIGQAELRRNEYTAALIAFERALSIAGVEGDDAAESAIKKAIMEVNAKIVEDIRLKRQQAEEKAVSTASKARQRLQDIHKRHFYSHSKTLFGRTSIDEAAGEAAYRKLSQAVQEGEEKKGRSLSVSTEHSEKSMTEVAQAFMKGKSNVTLDVLPKTPIVSSTSDADHTLHSRQSSARKSSLTPSPLSPGGGRSTDHYTSDNLNTSPSPIDAISPSSLSGFASTLRTHSNSSAPQSNSQPPSLSASIGRMSAGPSPVVSRPSGSTSMSRMATGPSPVTPAVRSSKSFGDSD